MVQNYNIIFFLKISKLKFSSTINYNNVFNIENEKSFIRMMCQCQTEFVCQNISMYSYLRKFMALQPFVKV